MKPIFTTPLEKSCFFGYFDKSPFSKCGTRMLAHSAPFADRMPEANDVLEINLFDLNTGKYEKLADTRAWNWQQGCMLQWLGPDHNKNIIYNDRNEDHFVGVILDTVTGEKKYLPMPVYTVHPKGRTALCVDHERHCWFRSGYSYVGVWNETKRIPFAPDDGIWLMDLNTSELKQMVSLGHIAAMKPVSSMKGGEHYLEHLMYSPDGSSFAFYHRWSLPDGNVYTRLLAADENGENLRIIHDTGRATHFCWRNEREILCYSGTQNIGNKLKKNRLLVKNLVMPLLPLYKKLVSPNSSIRSFITGNSYILFDIISGKQQKVSPHILVEDGHPMFLPGCNNIFVSDTYQNSKSERDLFLFDLSKDKKINIASLRSNSSTDSMAFRCDLHPKVAFSGNLICVDTTHNTTRQMFVYDISELLDLSAKSSSGL
jgi:hypothetical protein